MSALPTPPLHEEPPKEPPRRATWKRVVGWIAAVVVVIIVVVVIAVVVALHSNRFHQYVLRTAEQRVSSALGSRVQARNFDLHWTDMSPAVDMYNVVVYGAPPYATPPLLTVDHIRLQVKITSILHQTWYLNDVRLDHPVARVFVDRRGVDNLPQTKSTSQSHTSIFDLGVRHALLDRGEVYYNNRKSVLNADLHDVSFHSAFNTAQRSYSGTLGYRDGHLQLESFRPIPHNLEAQFQATPSAFALQRAVLTSGRSQFVLTGTLQDYAHPRVQATYDAVVDAGEFRRIMNNPTVPSGVIRARGSMHYISEPNRPMLATLTLNGDLGSQVLRVQSSSFRGDIRDISAHYSIANGNLDVPDMRAHLLGGELTGSLTTRNLAGASQSRLQARLRGVSLEALKAQVSSPALRQVVLRGVLNADANANWGKTFNDLVARTDATIRANAAPAKAAAQGVPVNGVLHARYAAASQQLTLAQSYLSLPATSLTLNGTVSSHSSLQVRLQSSNLHELETVADTFRTPAPGQTVQPLGLYGTATFVGAVRGSTAAPQITGELTASNLRLKGSSWRLLRTGLQLSPSSVSLANGLAEAAPRGRIAFNLSAGLRHWSFTKTSPFQARVNASQLNVADLERVAGAQAPVTGTLSANISAHGTETNPVGNGHISLNRAQISSEPIQSATVNFQGTGNEVQGNLALHMAAGNAQSTFTYFPKQDGYIVQLQAQGIRLDQLQTLKARGLQVAGVLNLTASGQGTVNNPQLTASLQVPQLHIENQTISGLALQANVANHLADVALNTQAVNTWVRARARVALTGNYDTDATLDTGSIPLQPLFAIYVPTQAPNMAGQTELHATLRGPLKQSSLLDAHITIPTLQVSYKNAVQIGAVSPIHVDYTNGVLALQRTTIRGTDTDLQVQGAFPVKSTAPQSLLLLGTIDLKIAQLFSPDITSSGQVRFNINSFGQRANPNVQGQVEIVNANLSSPDVPIGFANGNGLLTLTKDRLDITRFSGTVGGGAVTATGGVVYRPSLKFDLAMAGQGVRLLYPAGVREALGMNLALTGTTQAALLSGQVRVYQISFTPDFDLTNFIGNLSGAATAPPPAQSFSNNLKLNVGLQSTTGINATSRSLSVEGNANLHVQGTAADPVLLGRVNLTGGDLIFRGNRYVLQGGTIDFINPTETQPVVNVAVNTTIQQYNIHMRFQGPADHLRTSYASDPALPPADIIHLLAFGQTQEAAAANPALPASLEAEGLLASGVSSQITSRVEKIAGISQLSVDPVLSGSNQQNPGARVTIQQRVTGSLFVTFSTDVTSTQRQIIEVQYKVSPRLSVIGTRDQNGGFGFDTRLHKTW